MVLRMLAVPLVLMAPQPFESSIRPLPASMKKQLKRGGFWKPGCPVPLSELRLLTVSHRGFDRRTHTGQIVVNRRAARPLRGVFRELYELRFPIRHMRFDDVYGPRSQRPRDNDVSGSFECRQAVPSPCTGGTRNGSWSNHAYGLAVDINPVENPYVGCGATYDKRGRRYLDRSRHRPGMVTRRVVRAFRRIGWRWGGSWPGSTKDYQHFSVTGR